MDRALCLHYALTITLSKHDQVSHKVTAQLTCLQQMG